MSGYNKYVKKQKYCSVSMLSVKSFPKEKRDLVKDQEVYGIMVHGIYENEKDMFKHCEKLGKKHTNFDIYPMCMNEKKPFEVGEDETKNSKIIYRNEKLNNILNSEDMNKVNTIETKTTEEEDNINEICEVKENEEEGDNKKFTESSEKYYSVEINEQNYVCLSIYSPKFYRRIPEELKDNKIIDFEVLVGFSKLADAVKFRDENKDKLIFIMYIGKWNPFFVDIMKNADPSKNDEKEKLFDEFMDKYMNVLKEISEEEKERKTKNLEGANVVSGKYDMMEGGKYNMEEKEEINEKQHIETDEERVDRELRELEEEENRLKETQNTKYNEDEFNDKCAELFELHKRLNK